ncbi:uncharacterized protein [Temnothorax longispinosus]|uniref:uncharacterized protein n=1 Tax=Temnothorax longispinosus TaxID=300112 RepID=UPI003A9A6544
MDDDQIQDRWCQDCDTVVPISENHDCSIYVDSTISSSSTSNTSNKNDYSERLIAAVFERKILWNSKLPYKLRGPLQIKLLWTEMDTCLGTTPGTSQIKWKSLRDRFVKEHTIECTYVPSGSAAVKKRSSWLLYESLRFLVPTINYRKTTSNIENINPNMLPSSTKKAEHVILSILSISNIKKEMQYNQEKNKNILLKSQLLPSKQIYSRQNSTNSDTISELVHQSKCSKSSDSNSDYEISSDSEKIANFDEGYHVATASENNNNSDTISLQNDEQVAEEIHIMADMQSGLSSESSSQSDRSEVEENMLLQGHLLNVVKGTQVMQVVRNALSLENTIITELLSWILINPSVQMSLSEIASNLNTMKESHHLKD